MHGKAIGRAMEKYKRGDHHEVLRILTDLQNDLRYDDRHVNHIYAYCLLGMSYSHVGDHDNAEEYIDRAYAIHEQSDTKKEYNLSDGSYRYLLEFLAHSLEHIDHTSKAQKIRLEIEDARHQV